MSASEILVSLFGLLIGYWLISNLITRKTVFKDKFEPTNDGNEFQADHETETSSDKECYLVLGVSRTASMPEIQAAYKSLIRQYHPDKVASLGEELRNLAEKKSKEINVAYREVQELRGREP